MADWISNTWPPGVSKQLSLLIEGESLLNDGTAMVAFAVLIDIITGKTDPDGKFGWFHALSSGQTAGQLSSSEMVQIFMNRF